VDVSRPTLWCDGECSGCGSRTLLVTQRRAAAGRRCLQVAAAAASSRRQQRIGEVACLVVVEANAQLRQLGKVHPQQVTSVVHILRVQTLHIIGTK